MRYYLVSICLIIMASCSSDTKAPNDVGENNNFVQFSKVDDKHSNIDFENTIVETPTGNLGSYDYFFNGGGVSAGDINNDGLPDLFFTANQENNRLYLNLGDFQFKDITESSGVIKDNKQWSNGSNMVDINNDGLLDIYVCNSYYVDSGTKRKNELFINQGDLTFVEEAEKFGVADTSHSTQSTFFDYDNDGDVDLFVVNHSMAHDVFDNILAGKSVQDKDKILDKIYSEDRNLKIASGTLYQNNNGTFEDVTKESGLFKYGYGLGVLSRDFDHDGDIDIYVTNDFRIPDFFFDNNGDGTFTDRMNEKINHTSYYSMGCDAGDINNDGFEDILVVDMTPEDRYRSKVLMAGMNTKMFRYLTEVKQYNHQYMVNSLQMNSGDDNYTEISNLAKIAKTDWSWSAIIADMDLDGLNDIYITNGFKRDSKHNDIRAKNKEIKAELRRNDKLTKEKAFELSQQFPATKLSNYLFKNNGALGFNKVTKESGLEELTFSNGAINVDLDMDGDLDLVINNIDDKASIFRNNAIEKGSNHFIGVELQGEKSISDTYNAKVLIFVNGQKQIKEYNPSRSYLSTSNQYINFGIGKANVIERILVWWKSGKVSELKNVEPNQIVKVNETDATTISLSILDEIGYENIVKTIQPEDLGIDFVRRENHYDDFKEEVLLPQKQSQRSRALLVQDLNNDGKDDLVFGGSKEQNAAVYLQNEQGNFDVVNGPWENYKSGEDIKIVAFDYNKDGHVDLYFGRGSGEFEHESLLFQDLLFQNNGNGSFKDVTSKINTGCRNNCGTILIGDYNNDGYEDILMAAHAKGQRYPLPDDSYFLLNKNGTSFDCIPMDSLINLPEDEYGLWNDGLYVDVNYDGAKDIVLVGEWTSPKILIQRNGTYKDKTQDYGLQDESGWYYSCSTFTNQKNERSIIFGNLGKNNKFHPSKEHPMFIYADDFDDTGTLDVVLAKNDKGTYYPVRGKQCTSEQMPVMGQKFPTFDEFAKAPIEDILGDGMEQAFKRNVSTFGHKVLHVWESGESEVNVLPSYYQLSPIMDMALTKINNQIQFATVGNIFEAEPETSRYDSKLGIIARLDQSDAKSVFVKGTQFNYEIQGNAKAIESVDLVQVINKNCLIILLNQGEPQIICF